MITEKWSASINESCFIFGLVFKICLTILEIITIPTAVKIDPIKLIKAQSDLAVK
jgi:hypothetical protein